MIQIIRLKGKDKHLYRLVAPMVMDPEVIRANNYYVKAEDAGREEILSHLLPAVIAEFGPESWLLNSVTLVQDKETFEKFEFVSMDKKWTRYVKMYR